MAVQTLDLVFVTIVRKAANTIELLVHYRTLGDKQGNGIVVAITSPMMR